VTAPATKPAQVQWWRNDTGLLANTRDGSALPVGKLDIERYCPITGDGTPLARMEGNANVLVKAAADETSGAAYFMGLLPDSGSSSLARDGVVMFALLQRALEEGAQTLGKARQGFAAANALGPDPSLWRRLDAGGESIIPTELPLHAGVVANGDQMIALNRPPGEDQPRIVSTADLNELFGGLDFRIVTGSLEDTRSLTNEVWRTFLICMAAAILGEALLCLPPRRFTTPVRGETAPPASTPWEAVK
jgi:hypothetical protein